jgi:IclR family mhp operon transcriptional activator
MGRAYLAHTDPADRDRRIAEFREAEDLRFGEPEERRLRQLLDRIRHNGYAVRDPRTPPFRISTLSVPIMERGAVQALVSVSFFTSAVSRAELQNQIVDPLLASRANIEHALQFIGTSGAPVEKSLEREAIEMSF